jgi:hypothetical protein
MVNLFEWLFDWVVGLEGCLAGYVITMRQHQSLAREQAELLLKQSALSKLPYRKDLLRVQDEPSP